ncbi:hypothetical protein DPMN_110089 [Dreissena polymorpha]|uniref:Uncharacterized protein n=1 Tax=Dreissena polymorpha TaxID=45954 RepID=A0A9D4QNN9_DREPO|nr:hypothetical protein DPMN_110089 [Dreissena polymorpha]
MALQSHTDMRYQVLIVSNTHFLRKSPVAYSDGVHMPSGQDRPNPFEISREGHHGPAGLGSLRNRTAFMVFFGKVISKVFSYS